MTVQLQFHVHMNYGKRAQSEADSRLRVTIAQNVRELRRIRHLTQGELARRVGIRTGPMNAIEQGKHIPSGRVLFQLAENLQTSMDAILGRQTEESPAQKDPDVPGRAAVRSRSAGCGEETARYVAVSDTGDWPKAVAVTLPDDPPLDTVSSARIDAVCRAFLALEDLCGAQKRAHIPLYLPFVPDERGIEELTAKVRQMLGVNHAVIFDYLELLENAGLRVVFCPLREPVQSAAFVDPVNCNAFLAIREGMNAERQLFELLKRLGSIYAHMQESLCPAASGERSPAGGRLDRLHAARKFAALFLMPAQTVRASVAQLGIGPEGWTYDLALRMKHRFGVSAQAFVMRLKELRLIGVSAAESIEKRIEAHYARTNYGEPDSTRRVLSPNGRLGDLVLAALDKADARAEAREIEKALRSAGVKWA